jgi:hypothetical protein
MLKKMLSDLRGKSIKSFRRMTFGFLIKIKKISCQIFTLDFQGSKSGSNPHTAKNRGYLAPVKKYFLIGITGTISTDFHPHPFRCLPQSTSQIKKIELIVLLESVKSTLIDLDGLGWIWGWESTNNSYFGDVVTGFNSN